MGFDVNSCIGAQESPETLSVRKLLLYGNGKRARKKLNVRFYIKSEQQYQGIFLTKTDTAFIIRN